MLTRFVGLAEADASVLLIPFSRVADYFYNDANSAVGATYTALSAGLRNPLMKAFG